MNHSKEVKTIKEEILGNVYADMDPFPKTVWVWDIFGHGELTVNRCKDTGLWHRTITRILFRSKWTRESHAK